MKNTYYTIVFAELQTYSDGTLEGTKYLKNATKFSSIAEAEVHVSHMTLDSEIWIEDSRRNIIKKIKPDGRKNNGGHPTGGRKKNAPEDNKKQIAIYLSENEYKKEDWKSIVCKQFKEKFENKLKNICINEIK